MNVRKYEKKDIPALMRIWNEVVEAGQAYPQEEFLTEQTAEEFFAAQSFTAAAEDNGEAVGLYILHPNNVGRCGHIANASSRCARICAESMSGASLFPTASTDVRSLASGCFSSTLSWLTTSLRWRFTRASDSRSSGLSPAASARRTGHTRT